MQAWQWLILVVVVAVLIPLVPYVLRKIDFQRQLRGDIPERKADASLNPNTPHPGDGATTDGDILARQARNKSMQNTMGLQ